MLSHYIAEVLRLQLKNAPFIAPMMDGSADKSVTEQEIEYVRFAKQGIVHEEFLSLELVEKADAPGLLLNSLHGSPSGARKDATRVGRTRWAGHTLRALSHVIKGYPALVQHPHQ